MTDDTMSVQALPGKSADADFLREMIGFAAQRLMDLEVGSLTGAGYGEKSSARLTRRNVTDRLIPRFTDQNSRAQSRRPIDMIFQGWSTSLFQASQQWSTMSS